MLKISLVKFNNSRKEKWQEAVYKAVDICLPGFVPILAAIEVDHREFWKKWNWAGPLNIFHMFKGLPHKELTESVSYKKIMAGIKWKNKSNISIGLVNVPFFSMINFSNTWGMGLNGARIIKTAITIRIE